MSFFDIFPPLDAEALKPQPNEGRDLPGTTRTVKQLFDRPVFDGIKLRALPAAKSTTPLIAPDLSGRIH
ncbi:MAG TPA: hypothetical protein VIJ35_19235 [Bradyrhizobium sp.]